MLIFQLDLGIGNSVGDPDLLVIGMDPDQPPDPDPSFSHKGVERTEKTKFLTQNFSKKIKFLRLKII